MKNIICVTLIVIFCTGILIYSADEDFKNNVKRIHEEAIVIDAHAHPLLFSKRSAEYFNLGIDNPHSRIDFIKMKSGGIDAVFYALPMIFNETLKEPSEIIFNSIKVLKDEINKHSDQVGFAKSVRDIKSLNAQGKSAVLITIEFPDFMEGRLELLDDYAKMGAASLVLSEMDRISEKKTVDNNNNLKLSEFGKRVVKRINELGIIIDISHLPDSLQKEVLTFSSRPVIASHSNARGVNDIPRNIPDDILKMIADKGGAVMVTFAPAFIDREYNIAQTKAIEEYKKLEKEFKEQFKGTEQELRLKLEQIRKSLQPESISFQKLVDHIDYIVKLVGADHVGIGSDWGGEITPKGLESAECMPNITAELLKRGYSEEDIIKILGGNLLRIIDEVHSKAE